MFPVPLLVGVAVVVQAEAVVEILANGRRHVEGVLDRDDDVHVVVAEVHGYEPHGLGSEETFLERAVVDDHEHALALVVAVLFDARFLLCHKVVHDVFFEFREPKCRRHKDLEVLLEELGGTEADDHIERPHVELVRSVRQLALAFHPAQKPIVSKVAHKPRLARASFADDERQPSLLHLRHLELAKVFRADGRHARIGLVDHPAALLLEMRRGDRCRETGCRETGCRETDAERRDAERRDAERRCVKLGVNVDQRNPLGLLLAPYNLTSRVLVVAPVGPVQPAAAAGRESGPDQSAFPI